MLRSLRSRLRQLWEQCELFEAETARAAIPPATSLAPPASPARRPRRSPPPKSASQPGRSGIAPIGAAPPSNAASAGRPRIMRTHPQDRPFVTKLDAAFVEYNDTLFGGTLRPVPIRVSRRMKNRLGHYMAATQCGLPAEIAISRRHIRRDRWEDVLHTLVHEMVHQWQDQNGLPLDHGHAFRKKAREVGISARATRPVTSAH